MQPRKDELLATLPVNKEFRKQGCLSDFSPSWQHTMRGRSDAFLKPVISDLKGIGIAVDCSTRVDASPRSQCLISE
jgi:hypothetical protein